MSIGCYSTEGKSCVDINRLRKDIEHFRPLSDIRTAVSDPESWLGKAIGEVADQSLCGNLDLLDRNEGVFRTKE